MSETLLCCTVQGRAAAASRACALPRPYRAVLNGLVELSGIVGVEQLAVHLHELSREELEVILSDLDAIGLVETVPMEWLVELYLLDCAVGVDR